MPASYPLLNGIAPSWADVGVTIPIYEGETVEMVDFAALDWEDTVEIGEQKGASGGRILRRTTGDLKLDAKATFYRSGLRQLCRSLAKKAPVRGNQKRISLVGFDILIQHTPPGETDIYQVKIKGCRLLGRAWKLAEGPDAEKVDVKLHPIEIVDIIDGEEIVLL